MQIDTDLLITWGGIARVYPKNEFVFMEGQSAHFFYQIIKGSIKMYSTNREGKELIQGVFSEGDSFGEPPLFIDELYPATAIATEDTVLMRLSKDGLMRMLDEYPPIQKCFIRLFARRIYDKAIQSKLLINNDPESRITAFLETYKKNRLRTETDRESSDCILIPFTRQEIADFTGLRVETVIRTLNVMKTQKKVSIIERKLYY